MKRIRGFALLDVVLAIVIFAVGMLALASLQTNLTRSSVDANTRTVAANVGEETLERLRAFRRVSTDPDGVVFAFADIDDAYVGGTVNRGGIDYTVTGNVTGYNFEGLDKTTVTKIDPAVAGAIYDFKLVELNVAWDNNQSFQVDETTQVSNTDMNTGLITIKEVIPSIPSLATAAVAATDEGMGGVRVNYNPGENPDIIKLTLGDSLGKFKEATSPAPDVIRGDHIETWFDVVTYSQADPLAQATFLRREEFLAVSCECDLETEPDEADYGLKPTLWNGVAYTEGEKVDKPIGTAPNNVQQSEFCGICCRDHHDGNGNTSEDVYDRANALGQNVDHGHYARDRSGNIITTPVGDGGRYLEACRLVRKDGFMRVTQDAKQAALVGFPEGYLELDEGANLYSDYVVDAVDDYYTGSQSSFTQPDLTDFSARDPDGPGTDLPTATFANSQQLRSRAIYTDYLTGAAQDVIDDCFPQDVSGTPNADCLAPGASSPLEIYPFFDLQMTWLARWQNESLNNVVTVTNEPIEDGNTHSRGDVELVNVSSEGRSTVLITSEGGNLGLTATGPIDTTYVENDDRLYVDANLNSTPMPPIGGVVSGPLTSSIRRKPASDLTLTPSADIYCGQTDTEWKCVVGTVGTLTIGNYSLNGQDINICSDLSGRLVGTDTTTFDLPASGTDLRIWVSTDSACIP
ncbi:hypothetical protein ACFL00_03435 [Pseudomonadota bacterium]